MTSGDDSDDANFVFTAKHLSCRYGPTLPLVLRDVSIRLRPGKLCGVCGRTGSGKSTLSLAMLRCIEDIEGCMSITGIDAFKLPLQDYRKKVQLFPQDSAILSGSVREFLDPYSVFTDLEIISVLGSLTKVIRPSDSDEAEERIILPLNMHIVRSGGNLSAGQKQILALARACLASEAKVVILDEITSNMDKRVASAAIEVVKNELAGRNIGVLLIAHSMQDILACDDVVVMSQGKVVEHGEPLRLLQDESSALASMNREMSLEATDAE